MQTLVSAVTNALSAADHRGKTTAASVRYLSKQAGTLKRFDSVAHLVIANNEHNLGLNGIEHHIGQLRNNLRQVLWSNNVVIGNSILEDLIFYTFSDASIGQPLAHIVRVLVDIHDLGPGMAVFPLHSAHFPVTPFAKSAEIRALEILQERVLVFPQANSLDAALANIEYAASTLGVGQPVPRPLIRHWFDSRPLTWLKDNPILVVGMNNIPGSYYENQWAITPTMLFATSAVFALGALSASENRDEPFTTRTLNNFETLDFKHYLTLYPTSDAKLDGDCVPLMQQSPELVDVSDVNVLVTAQLDSPEMQRHFDQFVRGVTACRQAYFKLRLSGTQEEQRSSQARVAMKLYTALRSFRRSFSGRAYQTEAAVHLASAFEAMLTDHYSAGVGDTLARRAELALNAASVDNPARLASVVRETYKARCAVVHDGASYLGGDIPLAEARVAFVIVFGRIAAAIPRLSSTSADPIATLLNDHIAAPASSRSRIKWLLQGVRQDLLHRWSLFRA